MPSVASSPVTLTLSGDDAIEAILTDIPFFSVGLMTFAILTFVLVVKRTSTISLYLYSSSFFAFIAAIFDLSQLLSTSKPAVLKNATTGLLRVREVALALSVGSLYLFLWYFIAQRPPGEQDVDDEFIRLESGQLVGPYIHSASWRRWGIVGFGLKWSLLVLSISIPTLQIIWRLMKDTAKFGAVYVAESTIEVVVSAIFIIKIFLTIYLSPLTPWWRPLQHYLTPIFALLLGMSLGIGNLLMPVAIAVFTETTLGRFLRAVELYTLILFVLIASFHATPRTSSSSPLRRPSQLLIVKEKQSQTAFNMSTPASTTRQSVFVNKPLPANPDVVPTVNTSTPARHAAATNAVSSPSNSKPTFEKLPTLAPVRRTSIATEVLDVHFQQPLAQRNVELSKGRPTTSFSIASYYQMERRSLELPDLPKPQLARTNTSSPVYGLYGTVNPQATGVSATPRPRSSVMSLEELLRRQSELDKSIASLRLLAQQSELELPTLTKAEASFSKETVVTGADTLLARSSSMNTASILGRKPESVSNQSDFSLSIFPEPPAMDMPENVQAMIRRRNSMTANSQAIDDGAALVPRPRAINDERYGSAGTQYDVTSFIGGLTAPVGEVAAGKDETRRARSGSTSSRPASIDNSALILHRKLTKPTSPLSDIESENEVTPKQSAQSLRPLFLESFKPPPAAPATTMSSLSSSGPRPLRRDRSNSLRPLLLGMPTTVAPVSFSSSTKVPIGPRRQYGRRPNIGVPTPATGSETEAVPGAFERPRAPPELPK